ncbi:hypothetical protein GCM10025776_35210 [Corallincola platygyrae]
MPRKIILTAIGYSNKSGSQWLERQRHINSLTIKNSARAVHTSIHNVAGTPVWLRKATWSPRSPKNSK